MSDAGLGLIESDIGARYEAARARLATENLHELFRQTDLLQVAVRKFGLTDTIFALDGYQESLSSSIYNLIKTRRELCVLKEESLHKTAAYMKYAYGTTPTEEDAELLEKKLKSLYAATQTATSIGCCLETIYKDLESIEQNLGAVDEISEELHRDGRAYLPITFKRDMYEKPRTRTFEQIETDAIKKFNRLVINGETPRKFINRIRSRQFLKYEDEDATDQLSHETDDLRGFIQEAKDACVSRYPNKDSDKRDTE
jgi:hypothetical protein